MARLVTRPLKSPFEVKWEHVTVSKYRFDEDVRKLHYPQTPFTRCRRWHRWPRPLRVVSTSRWAKRKQISLRGGSGPATRWRLWYYGEITRFESRAGPFSLAALGSLLSERVREVDAHFSWTWARLFSTFRLTFRAGKSYFAAVAQISLVRKYQHLF